MLHCILHCWQMPGTSFNNIGTLGILLCLSDGIWWYSRSWAHPKQISMALYTMYRFILLDLSQFNFSISNYLPTPILIAYLLKTISEHFLSSCKSLIYIYRNKYSYIHRRLHDELRLLTETLIETSQLN